MTASAVVLRAVADALEAGMPPQALVDDPALAGALPPRARAALRASLRSGGSFAEALERGGAVDKAGGAVVAAGERGGFLPRALRLVADDIAEAAARRRRGLLALAYPAFLVVMASVILPLPALVTGGLSAYVARAAPGVVAVAAALFVGLVVLPRLPGGAKAALENALARVPLYGPLVVDTARASCLEALGRLVAAGVPVTLALPTAVAAGGLSSFRAGDASQTVAAGGTLAQALSAGGVVDERIAARVALAERTGTLDRALPTLAAEARSRARARFIALFAALGLLCFFAIAAAIGAAAVHSTQSYFDAIDAATKE